MTGAEGGFLTGRILIAMPGIGDPRFDRAIIYLCAHDEEHALGLALNRPVEGLTFADVLKRLDIPVNIDLPQDLVLIGGPVRRENGFVLHTDDYASPVPPGTQASTLKIGDGIALTATKDVLEAIASHNRQPRRAVMALGYAGWGAGQLERELKENVWLTCDADETLLFDGDRETKWARALAKIGINPQHLSAEAGRA